jgi:hypothetical protein
MEYEIVPQKHTTDIVLLNKQIEEAKKNLHEELHNRWFITRDKLITQTLHTLIEECSRLKQKWERKKENIDSLPLIEIASPHTSLLFSNKKLKSAFGFQSVEPWILNNITRIDISKNKLKVLPLNVFMEHCPQLKELHAAHNKIEYITYRSDRLRNKYAIAKNTSLQRLDLSYNNLESFDINMQWQSTPYLHALNLSNNIQLYLMEKPSMVWLKPYDVPWPIINIQETGISKSQDEKNIVQQWYRENIVYNSKTNRDLNITSSLCNYCAMLLTVDWFYNFCLARSLHFEKFALALVTNSMAYFFRVKARNIPSISEDEINKLVIEGINY